MRGRTAARRGPRRTRTADRDPRHGVSPLGLDSTIAVVVDRELLDYESVLVGAGVAGVEIELSPVDLIDATHAVVDGIAVPAQRSLD